jgi:hypothetical protein
VIENFLKLSVEIQAGVPYTEIRNKKQNLRWPWRVLVCFIPRKRLLRVRAGRELQNLHQSRSFIKSADTLRKMLHLTLRSWGEGSNWLTLQPGKKNLLPIRSEFLL